MKNANTTMTDAHIRLLKRIWGYLRGPEGRVPADWAADQLARLDRTEGDIDTLTTRIAHVRTWTYVSHASGWMDDARHWQERARASGHALPVPPRAVEAAAA